MQRRDRWVVGVAALTAAGLVIGIATPYRSGAQNKPDSEKTFHELVLEAQQRMHPGAPAVPTPQPAAPSITPQLAGASYENPPPGAHHEGYDDTPLLPGNKWHVHDKLRPEAPLITPGTFSTQEVPGRPPSDATVLFDGTDLSKWENTNGQPANWKVENGYMEVRGGQIRTRDKFGDCQLHIEWSAPNPPRGTSQGRGNSGIFLMGRYEFQVLDSYHSSTYADGAAAGIYGQYPPQVNATLPPGQWNVYDIIWEAPRFKDGKLETPAYVTIVHNGVLVHNHTALIGSTGHRTLAQYTPHDLTASIELQDHGNPVHYRNIWIRPIKNDTELE